VRRTKLNNHNNGPPPAPPPHSPPPLLQRLYARGSFALVAGTEPGCVLPPECSRKAGRCKVARPCAFFAAGANTILQVRSVRHCKSHGQHRRRALCSVYAGETHTHPRATPALGRASRLFRPRRSLILPTDGERVVLRRRQPRVGEERAPRGPLLLHSLLPPHHRGVVIAARACCWAACVCAS
jgi:hypothetical protein